MFMIETCSESQSEIINNIIKLYCPRGIDLDPTFSIGNFYKHVPEPKLKYDLKAQAKGVTECDCRHLPLADCSQQTIMFDPPFVCGSRAEGKPGIIKERFGYYKNVPELLRFYEESIDEFYRLLAPEGILIFKCQDTIESGKQYLSHVSIINYASKVGFYPLDLYILIARNVLISPNMQNQQHARKTHSYFLVFKKTKSPVGYCR